MNPDGSLPITFIKNYRNGFSDGGDKPFRINDNFILNDVKKISKKEQEAVNTRSIPLTDSISTYSKTDNTLIRNSIPYRSGHQVFEIPPMKSRPYIGEDNGRNLWLLESIRANAKKDYADNIIKNPLKLVRTL